MRKNFISLTLTLFAALIFGGQVNAAEIVPQWSVHELTFMASGEYSNPYTQAALTVSFTGPGNIKQKVRGFWDGGQTFKVRFTPTVIGDWSYATESGDAGLNGRKGSFGCGAPAKGSKGFLRRDAQHPYHFIFDDGTRFFMFGQTYYALMRNALAGDGWQAAVENSRRAGMNKVRMQIFTPGQQSKTQPHPAAAPFLHSSDGYDRDRLDLAFWRKLDVVVGFMAEKDMLADLILFWSNPVSYGTDEQNYRFASYAVARYAAFQNVIWCVANEWNYTKKPRELFIELGKLIKAEDAWAVDVRPGRAEYVRALSVHQQTRQDFQFFDQTWLSHAIVQLGVRNQGKTFRGGNEWEATNAAEEGRTFRNGDEWGNYSIVLNYGRRMPVVNDEYGYIGEPEDQSVPKGADGKHPRYTRAKHRQTIWGIYAGGGYAAAGDKYDYPDGRPYFSSNWHDTEEYGDISRLIEFFTTKGVEYWRMAPRNELVKSGQRVYVLFEPGRQYVTYAAAGGSFSVELTKGSYEARRYDPRTGKDILLSQSNGGIESFTLPDTQDWVIYLRAKSATPATRNQQSQRNPEGVIFDVNLTKGNAGPGQVFGGVWERGWRVTGADHERIVFDAGRAIASGYLEVSFTASQPPVTEPPRKINYFGLHEDASLSQNKHEGDILYVRTGNRNYQFSKVKAVGKKFGQKEWQQLAGNLADWVTDDRTAHTIKLEWKDGSAHFYDTKGNKYSCARNTTCGGDYPVDRLRYVFLGPDNYTGFTPQGVRFLRVRLAAYDQKDAAAAQPE